MKDCTDERADAPRGGAARTVKVHYLTWTLADQARGTLSG